MKSICFFSCYYKGDAIPAYVKYYLQELGKYFDETVLITNKKDLSEKDNVFLTESNVKILHVRNEGYDFGMWNKAFQNYDIKQYDRVGLVNDSCILFGKLENFFHWMEKEKPDLGGFTDSYLISYHVQSYFMVIEKDAILLVAAYFDKYGVVQEMKEVIKVYEVGLSKYLIDNGKNIRAMFNVPDKGEYNYALLQAKNLIKQGFPMVKKKIITRLYTSERWWSMVVIGFDPFPSHYIKLIKSQYNVPDSVFKDLIKSKSAWDSLKFNAVCLFAIIWGRLTMNKKIVKG